MKRPPPPPPPPVKFSNGPNKPPGARPVQFGDPTPPIIGHANVVAADLTVYLYAALIRAQHIAERVAEGDQMHPSVIETVGRNLRATAEAWRNAMASPDAQEPAYKQDELWQEGGE